MGRLDAVPILTSRGCPYRCSYCASKLLNRGFRMRDPFRVVDEIEHWSRTRGVRNFAFYDDALLVNSTDRAVPMLEEILRRGLELNFHCPNGLHLREITPRLAKLLFGSRVPDDPFRLRDRFSIEAGRNRGQGNDRRAAPVRCVPAGSGLWAGGHRRLSALRPSGAASPGNRGGHRPCAGNRGKTDPRRVFTDSRHTPVGRGSPTGPLRHRERAPVPQQLPASLFEARHLDGGLSGFEKPHEAWPAGKGIPLKKIEFFRPLRHNDRKIILPRQGVPDQPGKPAQTFMMLSCALETS